MTEYIEAHGFGAVRDALRERLSEDAPGYVQVLTGPRQVGKTTILHELERDRRWSAIYAAADAPAAALPYWWERLLDEMRRAAGSRKVVLLVDEVQYLPDWGRRIKAAYDEFKRQALPVRMVVSGSSALQLGKGSRESMAGRFERLHLAHWSAADLVREFRLTPDEAVKLYVTRGACPGAMPFRDDPQRWADYVRESIVEPAVGRDLLALELVRKPALLRQVMAVAAGHPAEIVALQKIRGMLADAGALDTVAHYLQLLEQAYLVAALEKYSPHSVRRRAAPPKLLVLNQAFIQLAAPWPGAQSRQGELRGRQIENACGAHAWNAGQQLRYWREEPHEVDYVMSGSWGSWAIEVKTGSFGTAELGGLLEFCGRYREFRPLLLCDEERAGSASGLPLAVQPWAEFLLKGPPP